MSSYTTGIECKVCGRMFSHTFGETQMAVYCPDCDTLIPSKYIADLLGQLVDPQSRLERHLNDEDDMEEPIEDEGA